MTDIELIQLPYDLMLKKPTCMEQLKEAWEDWEDVELLVVTFFTHQEMIDKLEDKSITVKFPKGEYGLHADWFNFVAVIDGKEYELNCGLEFGALDLKEYEWGLEAEVNRPLLETIGENALCFLIDHAFDYFLKTRCN